MPTPRRSHPAAAAATLLVALLGPSRAPALTLRNSPGDGQVSVEVDGYGSFGYETEGIGTGDAMYDPVGAVGPSSTTWESAVYFRRPKSGTSRFLTTGEVGTAGASGHLPDVAFTLTESARATSTFTYAGLQFDLEQRLEDAHDAGTRTGTFLVQTYSITNPGVAPVSFDLVRYYEGDLYLGGAGVPDGGGHLVVDGTEFVFETDVAGEPAASTNFIGITAAGGTTPATGRYEVGQWSSSGGFPGRIAADMPLGDVVFGDGADADEFVDAGHDYDVGIALANVFALAPGERVTYVTTTLFGTGAPSQVVGPPVATTTTVPTGTPTTTTLPPAEVCGNCIDDDANGLTDFEDPACCVVGVAGTLTLKSARIKPAGGRSALQLHGLLPASAGASLPASSSVFVQLRREGGAELLCAALPVTASKRTLRFADKGGAVAGARGIQKAVFKLTKKGTTNLVVSGKQVALASPSAGRVGVTLGFAGPAAGQCAASVQEFRAVRKGAITFP
jgi:hypothetical protein